jgi:hypothetical protein
MQHGRTLMTYPAPIIGLVDALSQLMDKLSVADAMTEKEGLERATEALGLPEPDPAWPAPPGSVAALLHAAPIRQMRHEAGIRRLDDALSKNKLHLRLRHKDGRLIQLTSIEWRANPYRRDIIISGQWRDEEWRDPKDRHGACEAVLIKSEFDAWCSQCVEPVAVGSASAERPLPEELSPMEPKDWLKSAVQQRNPGEKAAEFAKRIAPIMAEACDRKEVKRAWAAKTIEARLSEYKLWSGLG